MNSNTIAPIGLAEEMAQLLSKHITMYISEHPETNIGDVEELMSHELQTVGRRSMEMALTASDVRQPTVTCACGGAATYFFRRQAQIITVFGQVSYRRSYHLCSCGQGVAPLDRRLKLEPGQVNRGLVPLLALLGVQTSFDEAQRLAQQLLLLDISDNSIRKATQAIGEVQKELETQWRQQSKAQSFLRQQTRQKKKTPQRIYGSIDGVQVPVGKEWRELKVGCWYQVDPLPQRQWPSRFKQRIGHLETLKATAIDYYCDIIEADDFSELLWATGCQRLADENDNLKVIHFSTEVIIEK